MGSSWVHVQGGICLFSGFLLLVLLVSERTYAQAVSSSLGQCRLHLCLGP